MVLANFAGLAFAALLAFAEPFSFEYPGTTDAAGTSYLVITANEPIDAMEITLQGDGQTITKAVAGLKRGKTVKIEWTQRAREAKYELEIRGKGAEASFGFEVRRAAAPGKIGKLQAVSSREDIIGRGTCTFQTPFALSRYEYKVYDGEGDVLAANVLETPIAAGGRFTLQWDKGAEVFMIWVRGEDEDGRFAEHKLVPWAVEIPHTEINFDTGKSNVKVDEAAKLDEASAVAFHELVALERVNKAVNASITPRLYIVGYTDTVGSPGSNKKLSRNRAKAIAEYFHEKGFWAEIHYAGMGERGLAVETGDNVDEVRNRRALYLIGVDRPRAGGQIPASWTKLAGARPKPAGFQLPPLPERWKNYREERRLARLQGSQQTDMSGELPVRDDAVEQPSGPIQLPEDAPAAAGGPPPVEDTPGATAKGCRVRGPAQRPALGVFVLLALGWVRRRRA